MLHQYHIKHVNVTFSYDIGMELNSCLTHHHRVLMTVPRTTLLNQMRNVHFSKLGKHYLFVYLQNLSLILDIVVEDLTENLMYI